jgi:cadmium resistance protein CadD (predicted permease)
MFLFEAIIWGFVPDERIGLLIFGVALILLAIGLRWLMKRNEKPADNEIKHITEQH